MNTMMQLARDHSCDWAAKARTFLLLFTTQNLLHANDFLFLLLFKSKSETKRSARKLRYWYRYNRVGPQQMAGNALPAVGSRSPRPRGPTTLDSGRRAHPASSASLSLSSPVPMHLPVPPSAAHVDPACLPQSVLLAIISRAARPRRPSPSAAPTHSGQRSAACGLSRGGSRRLFGSAVVRGMSSFAVSGARLGVVRPGGGGGSARSGAERRSGVDLPSLLFRRKDSFSRTAQCT
jgi:hypothetical protein